MVLSEVRDKPGSSEGTRGAVQIPVSVKQEFFKRPSTTQARAAEYRQWVVRSPKACVLPGKEKPRELLGFVRFQEEVQQRTALGLDYHYVPPNIMDIIEGSQREWEDDMVWEYMHFPKPLRKPHCEQAWTWLKDIQREWQPGRAIYRDRMVVVKAGQPAKNHSVAVREADGNLKRLPNPHYYL